MMVVPLIFLQTALTLSSRMQFVRPLNRPTAVEKAVVRHPLERDAVDVGVQDVRNVQNRVVVQVHHLVKARVHHAAHAQDQRDEHHRQNPGQVMCRILCQRFAPSMVAAS